LARKAGRIRPIELAFDLMTDHKQIKPSVAQILFWYNKGNGYGGGVCFGGFNVVFWTVNNR
jgi:hypothetical protein